MSPEDLEKEGLKQSFKYTRVLFFFLKDIELAVASIQHR